MVGVVSDEERSKGLSDIAYNLEPGHRYEDDHRESPITVARKWLPWCIGLIVVLTIVWIALVAWDEIERGGHVGWQQIIIAIVYKASPASPFIVLCAIMAVSVSDFIGGVVLVTARYLSNKFVKPLIERHEAQGAIRERRRWTKWNNRRLEAEARDEPFDEPPPSGNDEPEPS